MHTLKNYKGQIAEALGMSLGQGLGSGINTFYANKALDDVISDKSNLHKSQSEKMGLLQSALSPYGEAGQQIFNQRMQIEQQVFNEKQQINLQKLAEEKESRLFKHQENIQKLKNENRALPGGVTAQPVPNEVNTSIGKVLSESKGLSADELKRKMDEASVPPIFSNQYVENRRREDESNAKNISKENQIASEQDIKFHQESSDYEEKLLKELETAKRQVDIIEDLEKDVNHIRPNSLANIFKGLGTIGDKISNALLNPKQAGLQSAIPEFLEGRKELFGIRLSDADLRLLQDKLPDIGKSPEANKEILRLMKKYANLKLLKGKAAENILENKGIKTRGGKLRPLNYQRMVEQEFDRLNSENSKTSFDELPPAHNYPKGTSFTNQQTGEKMVSDGKEWKKQQ